MLRTILLASLLAVPLGAQATHTATRDSAIVAAALREAPEGRDVRAGIYSLAGDSAVVAVMQVMLPRDTTPGEVLSYLVTVVRRSDEWVTVGLRRPIPELFAKPKYTPTKLAPPKPANRVSRP